MQAQTVARGGSFTPASQPSPILAASAQAWAKFVRALAVHPLDFQTPYAIGMFGMRPRRLGDIGVMVDVHEERSAEGRKIWVGAFAPASRDFLRDFSMQKLALAKSMVEYAGRIASGALKTPAAMDLSSALGVLHCAGEGGLKRKRFPETEDVFQKTQGIF